MGWEKVSSLVEFAKRQLEVEKKKEELRQKFKEAFGIEPQKITTEKALSELRDDELPEDLRAKIHDLLNDLDYRYDYFKLSVEVYRLPYDEEHDWRVSTGSIVTLEKRENKLHYLLEIYPLDYDDDC